MEMFKTEIKSVAHYVPPKVVTNADLSQLMETSDEWIIERTGIKERRFAEVGTPVSAIALPAAKSAIEKAGWNPKDVDLIVFSTLSPDYYFPGVGVQMQHQLGIGNVMALDIRAQCSGFVYGINTVDAFIRSGKSKKVLFICAEVQSPALDLTTRGRDIAVLFGDGAGALALEAVPVKSGDLPQANNKSSGVIDSIMGSDGSGAEVLYMRAPGTATPNFIRHADLEEGTHHPKMDGRQVFKNAVTRMCSVAEEMLKKHKVKAEDVKVLFPHQANLRINDMVREKLGLMQDKVFNNIHRFGNTTSATIPICISEAVEQGKLEKGDLMLTLAFGAGFTWGCNLIRW